MSSFELSATPVQVGGALDTGTPRPGPHCSSPQVDTATVELACKGTNGQESLRVVLKFCEVTLTRQPHHGIKEETRRLMKYGEISATVYTPQGPEQAASWTKMVPFLVFLAGGMPMHSYAAHS